MEIKSEYYQSNEQFLIAVDCIIFGLKDDELCLLLLKRGIEPCKGQWSLAGGFLKSNESINDAASRVLNNLTGLSDVYMDQVGIYGEIDRDPGDRVISAAYYALINMEDYNPQFVKKYHTSWININCLPELVFDHRKMVDKALAKLQQRAAIRPLGFNLLPEKFTLTQLQKLYEAIYQKTFDNRNFRKKFQSFDFIEKLDEKDKLSSKRGAFYHKFNKAKYEKASTEGLYLI